MKSAFLLTDHNMLLEELPVDSTLSNKQQAEMFGIYHRRYVCHTNYLLHAATHSLRNECHFY